MWALWIALLYFYRAAEAAANRYIAWSFNLVQDPNMLTPDPVYNLDDPFFMLGAIFTLTSEVTGSIASPGMQRLEAFRYAVNLANTQGSQWPGGRNITYVYTAMDSQGDDQSALAAAMTFVRNNITSIVGPAASNEAFNVANYVADYSLVVVSYASTAVSVAPSTSFFFVRTLPDDFFQMQGTVAMLDDLGWNLVCLLYTNDTYGSIQRDDFFSLSDLYNINSTCEYSIPASDAYVDLPSVRSDIPVASDCIANSIANVVVILGKYAFYCIAMTVSFLFHSHPFLHSSLSLSLSLSECCKY